MVINLNKESLSLNTSISSVQLLSRARLFVTRWITARQASLSITNSRSLLKLMSIESVMPSNHLILCHSLLLLPSTFPRIRGLFQLFGSLHQVAKSIKTSASASVLPVNIQGWFPLGLTGCISLQSKGHSGVFSSTTIRKHGLFRTQPFFVVQLLQPCMTTGKTIALTIWTIAGKVISLLFNMLSRFVCPFTV